MGKEEIIVSCTYCNSEIKVLASDVDRIVKCNNCKKFTQVPGKVQKRMDLECPVCSTMWNLPLKLRGKIYTCWKCQTQTQLLEMPKLTVEQISFVEEVEQGAQDNEIVITLSNHGTPAILTSIQLAFQNNRQDVSAHYHVIPSPDNTSQVDYTGPIELKCVVAISEQAPPGKTTLDIEILGKDALDDTPLDCKVQIYWNIIPRRGFLVTTEHDNIERVATPFALKLMACNASSVKVDVGYEGQHYVQFESTVTQNTMKMPSVIPKMLRIEFSKGIGISPREFIFYDTSEKPKIVAWEDAMGGPEGGTEEIQLTAGQLERFEIISPPSQMNYTAFQGKSELRALDRYSNVLTSFAEDVWIYPASNTGTIFVPGLDPNIVPGRAFRNGIANLTELKLMYVAEHNQILPKKESFIVSYQEKEGCSSEIVIAPNPLNVLLDTIEVPKNVEQGQEFKFDISLNNQSLEEINVVIYEVEHHFFYNSQPADQFYRAQLENRDVECAFLEETRLNFTTQILQEAPIGATDLSIIFYFKDTSDRYYGQRKLQLQWNVEPKGRIFQILSPDPCTVQAGKKFGLKLGAYFQGNLNVDYSGIHRLNIETTASSSSMGIAAKIPETLDVLFEKGVGVTEAVFNFTNAEETPELLIVDRGPGGPRTEPVIFTILPCELGTFLFSLRQTSLINGESFGELNQIIAQDIYGNLKVDFSQDCRISPASQRGSISIFGTISNVIPASSFQSGIADLGELKVAYRSDVQDQLPRQEEFCIECQGKNGRSKPITIAPSSAQLSIVRCSAPEEIEHGEEEYPIYLELENKGDRLATISSVVFTFDQNGDISSHYTIIPSPNNSYKLIPKVPLQLSYIIKLSLKTPLGLTNAEVKVYGIETDTSVPLQDKTTFRWTVEGGVRTFQLVTINNNREQAGNPFGLKIESFINREKDQRYNGEKVLQCHSNATASGSGKSPKIPEKINLNFQHGEATSSPQFVLTNTAERPIIRISDTTAKIEGTTEPIIVSPGIFSAFKIKLASSIRDKELWQGENVITALDGDGNIIQDFRESVSISLKGVHGYLSDSQKQKVSVLMGDWFRKGILNVNEHKFGIVCESGQKLPTQAMIILTHAGKESISAPFEILPPPVTVTLQQVHATQRVVQGEHSVVQAIILNDGTAKIDIGTVQFSGLHGQTSSNYSFEEGDNPSQLMPGKNNLSYLVAIPKAAPCGKLKGKAIFNLTYAANEIHLTGDFEWDVEAAGRSFTITTENFQNEIAGVPFGLQISVMLNGKNDSTYAGTRILSFTNNANASPSGQAPRIPKTLTIDFQQGRGTTGQNFIFYNSQEKASVEIQEDVAGGPKGVSPEISVRPGPLQKFKWLLQTPQTNATAFVGENTITAFDAFDNLKNDFQEDVRVYCKSQKGDVQLAETSILNVIPGHFFQDGKADLSARKFCYQAMQSEHLPITEVFIAAYGEKKGESTTLVVKPRPAHLTIESIACQEQIYQGQSQQPCAIAIKNTGDITAQMNQTTFYFEQEGIDTSATFTVEPCPTNAAQIASDKQIVLEYMLSVATQAKTGSAQIKACISGKSPSHDQESQIIQCEVTTHFNVLERLRELKITTGNNNKEMAGEPFKVKIAIFKDEAQDKTYTGKHDIHFEIKEKGALYPASEQIEFKDGVGESSKNFILTDAQQKACIIAKEENKAHGTSSPILIIPGNLHSLKISFDEKKAGTYYQLQMLDKYDNILQKDYKIDESLKQGVILTGSGGTFYEILEIVGHGAMGKVYKGKRLNDGLIVAIKTMLFSALSDISRFLLEGHMLIRFNHPNIVKGYDLRQICAHEGNKVESKFFMVMEFLPGQSVKDLMESTPDGYLSYSRATHIILHVTRALAYMWQQQTIHRDIKPENIQITEDNRVKLIDLGIARGEGGMLDISLTQKDTVVGSYPYLAPERLKETTTDYRSDVYSLGATYYHMVTSSPPYIDTYKGPGGRDLLEYLIRIRTKKMPTPPNKLQEMPASISNLIMAMLQIKFDKRCKSAEELLAALEEVNAEVNRGK